MFVKGTRTIGNRYRFLLSTDIKPDDIQFSVSGGQYLTPEDYTINSVPDGVEIVLSKPLPLGGGLMNVYAFFLTPKPASHRPKK